MKNVLLITVLVLGISNHSLSADYGLGITIKNFANSIYIPVKINDEILLEPYFSHYKQKQENNFHTSTSEVREIGLGFFFNKSLRDKFSAYYGLRAAYAERKYDYQKHDGYRFAPTLGVNYEVISGVSIGGEFEWYKSKVDGSSEIDGEIENSTLESSGTDTRVILRYFF